MIGNLKVGTDGELAVAAKMAQLGYNISFPMGGTPYDLIAEKDGVCVRVQVKAATLQKRGSYRVNLSPVISAELRPELCRYLGVLRQEHV